MPFEMLGPGPEEQPEMMPLPNPPKLGVIQTSESALISDYRVPTIWVAIMERDPAEARETLLKVIRNDIKAEVPAGFEVPCIVKETEGKNHREQAAIRRAQRREAMGKLALTDENLLRVSDLIGEVGRHIGSLRRQAAKAMRYKRLSKRLRILPLIH